MRSLWTAAIVFCLATSTYALDDLSELLEGDGTIFHTNAQGFMTPDKSGQFFWLSNERTGARYSDERTKQKLTLFGMKVWEALLRFTPTGTREMTVSLYNRGDAGELDENSFKNLLTEFNKKLTNWAGAEGVTLKKIRLTKGKGYIRSRAWQKLPFYIRGEWVAGKQRIRGQDGEVYRAEYLRLKITQKTKTNSSHTKPQDNGLTTRATGSREKLTDNVIHAENGDVYVDNIPMVDQGKKGYCAVCVSARLLQYFGSDIGQDTIAQLADTKTGGGTNSDEMMEAISKAEVKLGIRVKTYKKWDGKELSRLLKDYNRLARRAGKKELVVSSSSTKFYDAVEADILQEIRCVKQKSDYRKFLSAIEKNVKLGIPVIWRVMRGIYKEGNSIPKERNGHLRLIIGYNEKEEKVLYSDTWGPGHELKYMSMDHAWSMSRSYYTFVPRNR